MRLICKYLVPDCIGTFYCTICFLLFTGTSAKSQIRLTASVDSTNYLIGDWIAVEVAAEHPYGVNILWKNPVFRDSATFAIISESKVDTVEQRGFLSENKTFVLTTYDTGIVRIPSFTYYYEDNGEVDSASTSPLILYVSTVEVDTSKSFRDIKPQVPVVVKSERNWLFVAIASAAVVIVVIFWWRMNIRKKQFQTSSSINIENRLPHEIALDKLTELEDSGIGQAGDVKPYYMRLTEILRDYIESGLHIPALENTTREIVASLRKNFDDRGLVDNLQEVLVLSDFVKFAKAKPSAEENQNALKVSRQFIERTKPSISEIPKAELTP